MTFIETFAIIMYLRLFFRYKILSRFCTPINFKVFFLVYIQVCLIFRDIKNNNCALVRMKQILHWTILWRSHEANKLSGKFHFQHRE